jgi:hypothetical protein
VLPLVYASAMVGLLNLNPHPMTAELGVSLASVIVSDNQQIHLHCVYALTINNNGSDDSTSAMQTDYLVDLVHSTIRNPNDPDAEKIPAQITGTDIYWTDGIVSYWINRTTGQYASEEAPEHPGDLFTSTAGSCSPA